MKFAGVAYLYLCIHFNCPPTIQIQNERGKPQKRMCEADKSGELQHDPHWFPYILMVKVNNECKAKID